MPRFKGFAFHWNYQIFIHTHIQCTNLPHATFYSNIKQRRQTTLIAAIITRCCISWTEIEILENKWKEKKIKLRITKKRKEKLTQKKKKKYIRRKKPQSSVHWVWKFATVGTVTTVAIIKYNDKQIKQIKRKVQVEITVIFYFDFMIECGKIVLNIYLKATHIYLYHTFLVCWHSKQK